jgi:hypothetical protein
MASPTTIPDSASEALREKSTPPPGVKEIEKEEQEDNAQSTEPSGDPSVMEKADELQPADGEAEGGEIETRHDEDGMEYPTGLKLGLITLALALSVFLIALVLFFIAPFPYLSFADEVG